MIGFAQKNKFKNVEEYSRWLMGYHENPQPDLLFTAFIYGVTNKEIGQSDGITLVISFFGSIFRTDGAIMMNFYDKVKTYKSGNIYQGFIASLWMANTTSSKALMERLLEDKGKKNRKGDQNESEKPFDIYNDPISDPTELDMIWADFFATGNSEDIKRIIKVLPSNNMISNAAKWSLTSNGIHYKKVFSIIQLESIENDNELIRKMLKELLIEINSN